MWSEWRAVRRVIACRRPGLLPVVLGGYLLAVGATAAGCEGDADSAAELDWDDGTSSVGGAGGAAEGQAGGPGFDPADNPCQDLPPGLICVDNAALTCDGEGKVAQKKDCGEGVCVPSTGCVLCIAGQYSCYGNQVRSCNTAVSPIQWDTVATCDPKLGQGCNATIGACEQLQPIGNGPSDPTGKYYQYAKFPKGSSVFNGGCDVDSWGDYLYVNRGNWYEDGQTLDVYHVELLDTDGDAVAEANQHPDNPKDPGIIEERVLSYVGNFAVPSLGMVHHSEVFALEDRVYFLNAPANPGFVFEYTFASGVTNPVVTAPSIEFAQLGLDEVTGTWYASHEYARMVYSYHQPSGEWVAEFAYPNLAGDHMDGLEVVTDPNTGTSYVYVSDMTSDYLGQYRRDRHGTWVQANLFEYQGTGDYVEGMGFGAFNHFWITSGDALYEVGGGELQEFTEPAPPPN